MKAVKLFIFLYLGLIFYSCQEDDSSIDQNSLMAYIELNKDLNQDDLIACAAGKEGGLFNEAGISTSVFFYPIEGATDFKYFEADRIVDSSDFSKYIQMDLEDSPVFNGYLWRFKRPDFVGEKMGVVTYKTDGKLHVCTPIRLKTNVKPTETNASLLMLTENGLTPTFEWEDGLINENVIYFQVISETNGDLISGTYTYDKNFTFYDLSNVVLNIKDTNPAPSLELGNTYHFTMMAVSEDNWVNLIIEDEFSTN